MNVTAYHTKYYANEQTRRCPADGGEELAGALGAAQVDLNPQQVAPALTLEDNLAGQKQVKALEAQRNTKRRALFDAQDEIDAERERLIAQIEGKLKQQVTMSSLFAIRWSLK